LGIEVLEVPQHIAQNHQEGLGVMSMYIEKGGKFFNYHPTIEEQTTKQQQLEHKKQEEKQRKEHDHQIQERQEQDERQAREIQNSLRQTQVLVEDQELVDLCSQPLRNYLMQNVIPALVDGLLDISRTQPEDPIDYLAEYLFKYSVGTKDKIKYEDDSTLATIATS
jgi:adenylate kinase